jgi:probable F420-dependent oxidoreductase
MSLPARPASGPASGRRPFRFGVVVSGSRNAIPSWQAMVREIDDLGYATLLMTDHVDGQYAPMVALGVAAVVSPRLGLGSLVVCNDFYNPVMLAREAASLQRLSGGRFELGLGAGWNRGDYLRTGATFDSPGIRISRLAESVELIRQCLAHQPFIHEGRHYRSHCEMPVTPPLDTRPRLTLGGGGQRMLTLAGQKADIVSINPQLTPAYRSLGFFGQGTGYATTDDKVRWVADAAGDRFDGIELSASVYSAVVTASPDRAAAIFARSVGCAPSDVLTSPHALLGTVDDMVATLQRRRDQWGISYIVVEYRCRHTLAPVVQRLTGT